MRRTNYKSDKWKSRGILKGEINDLIVHRDFSKDELIKIRDFIKTTKFGVGDKVECLFGDSGHKFWYNALTPFVTIESIIVHKNIPNELVFEKIPETAFYENDFQLYEGIK